MPTTPPVRKAIFIGVLRRRRSLAGRGGDAHVAAHGEPHADVAGERREHRADQEEDRAADPRSHVVSAGSRKSRKNTSDGEDGQRAELAGEVGGRALLDRRGDLLHLLGALAGREHLAHQDAGDAERREGDDRATTTTQVMVGCRCEGRAVSTAERQDEPRHSSSLTLGRAAATDVGEPTGEMLRSSAHDEVGPAPRAGPRQRRDAGDHERGTDPSAGRESYAAVAVGCRDAGRCTTVASRGGPGHADDDAAARAALDLDVVDQAADDREARPGRDAPRRRRGRRRRESAGALGAGRRPAPRRRPRRGMLLLLDQRHLDRRSGQCRRCRSTAREQASPTASRTSSRTASSTPARRATAAATRRAVRTCSGSALKRSSTVAHSGLRPRSGPSSSTGCPVRIRGTVSRWRDRFVDRGVDREHLGQAGDPEDLEDALLGADQAQRALMGTHPLEAADQHAETGGVEEVDALHVDDEVVLAVVRPGRPAARAAWARCRRRSRHRPRRPCDRPRCGSTGTGPRILQQLLSSGRPRTLGTSPGTVAGRDGIQPLTAGAARRLGAQCPSRPVTRLGADGQESPSRSTRARAAARPAAGRVLDRLLRDRPADARSPTSSTCPRARAPCRLAGLGPTRSCVAALERPRHRRALGAPGARPPSTPWPARRWWSPPARPPASRWPTCCPPDRASWTAPRRRTAAARPRSTWRPPRRSPPTSCARVTELDAAERCAPAAYDGDTPVEERDWVRAARRLRPDQPRHAAPRRSCPPTPRWASFLRA